ncbi:hypothetical protein [Sphingobacterium sp. LRF_L2]|uniref:hypothetical protein n=1 Tax=Sphingobacterium sp. LRF_L2 TaxID=3369421 RepID=UPI003F60A9B9
MKFKSQKKMYKQDNVPLLRIRSSRLLSQVSFYFLVLVFCFTPYCSYAQGKPQHLADHRPLMNKIWETFDMLMYKVEKADGKTRYTAYFPPALKDLNGKNVTIQGYMIPITTGRKHAHFLLSVLPVFQCMFCGQNGIPSMVEIKMKDNIKINFTDRPITVTGVVLLNGTDQNHAEIQLQNAIVKNND